MAFAGFDAFVVDAATGEEVAHMPGDPTGTLGGPIMPLSLGTAIAGGAEPGGGAAASLPR